MSDVSIRPATPTDIEAIQSVARRVWLDHYPGIITHRQIDYMLGTDYSGKALNQGFDQGVAIDLLLIGDEVQGFAAYGPAAREDRAKLHKLYLDTSFHGQGIGSMLLDHVIERCRCRGIKTLELQVNKHNGKAIRAYEKRGFVRRSALLNPIGDGYFMDDYVMEIELDHGP